MAERHREGNVIFLQPPQDDLRTRLIRVLESIKDVTGAAMKELAKQPPLPITCWQPRDDRSQKEGEPNEISIEEEIDLWADEKQGFAFSFLQTHIGELSTRGDIYEQATYLREAFDSWLIDFRWEGQEAISLKFEDLMPVAQIEFDKARGEVLGEVPGDFQERIDVERNGFEKMSKWGHLLAVLDTTQKVRYDQEHSIQSTMVES